MTFSRILSVAAVAAFASLGAQASELYGAGFDTQASSTLARSEVRAEGAQAVTQFKNYENPVLQRTTSSTLQRPEVRTQAAAANRAHSIASGELS